MKKTNKFGRRGWTPDRISSLEGKTYVITGANSGAGFEATRILLKKGASVIMMNRSIDKSNVAISELHREFGRDAKVSLVVLDLASLQSVREAAVNLLGKTSQIDALICNAAIAQIAKKALTIDGFESQLGVNHLGHFLLCSLLFECIEKSSGRIVMVGSQGYKMGEKRIRFEDINYEQDYTAWNSYAQSKLAQMIFGYELQRRVAAARKEVVVQVCHPGASRTNLINETASLRDRILSRTILPLIAQSAERGAWPEVMCATEEELESQKFYGPTKRAETVGPVGECSLDPCALDEEAAKELWALSEEKVGYKWSI